MRKLREELAKGADFAQAAARNSDCPDNGGDLGYFPRGQMVPEFENVVFSLKRGQISEVFRTEFGLHIATVTDKRPARPYEFEQVKDTIRRELRGGLRQKAIEDFIDAERAKARIEERPDLT
ncbi:MAG: Foldase protein PrsA 1 precursor [candidate division BRC1 bacterium ADurb.BinA364]|nr:MAG: Foldase protein PrsA 1 precursor [candidate division BRC1 bacterium ADurb.BinA364]